MNEQHTQAYLNLIEQLLNCASEAEVQQCFTDNQELLDRKLVQVIDQVVAEFAEEDKSMIASALAALGYLIRDFDGGNKDNNLEIAAACFENAKQVFTREAFPKKWADCQDALGSIYFYRIRGNRLENLKQAIKYCENALEVLTPEDFPEGWKKVQSNLELIHSKIQEEEIQEEEIIAKYTPRGEVGEFSLFEGSEFNLFIPTSSHLASRLAATRKSQTDFLVEVFQAVADSKGDPEVVYPLLQNNLDKLDETFAEILYQWATATLPTLASEQAYGVAGVIFDFSALIQQFPLGNRGNNLEIAIKGYQAAASVFTFDVFPFLWAGTQYSLGNAYNHRIKGEKAANLEAAIACFRESLKVFTPDAFPSEWATTQNNLGNAYSDRIKGEKADNLERAIACFRESLKVFTPDAFPSEWATTQTSLGLAYRHRIKGEKADNLERAIACYGEALKVYTPEAFPSEWAMTQNNMGEAYSRRIEGEKAENLERAISCYRESLKVRTPDAFPYDCAGTQNNLGAAYSRRIRGEKAENLEAAIACFRESLKVFTPDAFPSEWATTQNNLGVAYSERIRGKKAENLERAIAAYEQALKVYTFDAFPYDWAEIQNNLGVAYSERIRGKKAENLERAIAACEAALQVYPREAFPYEWARAQDNLGNAYGDRIRGERGENLERAIAACEAALQVYTREAFPYEWATTQNNLGLDYGDRIRGKRAENLEKAIAAYKATLQVYPREAFPYEWARTHNNLGEVYRKRIRGEQAENLEMAIDAYKAALQVHTPEAFPEDWARAQTNLGAAYSERIRGDRVENLEKAIAAYEAVLQVFTPKAFPEAYALLQNNIAVAYLKQIREGKTEKAEKEDLENCRQALEAALEIYTREAFPYEWARAQINFGGTYLSWIWGKRSREKEDVEKAIKAFEAALEIYTREAFPYEWAATQNNLGITYWKRIKGEKTENLETAISCYREALKVRTPDAFPLNCLETGRNLGTLAFEEGNWQLAIEAYNRAIEAVEISRSWAMTPQSKQEVMEAAIDVYQNIVQAYLNTKQIPLALEYVERSKIRNLVELLATRDLKPRGEISPAILEKLERLKHEIRTQQMYLATQERTYYSGLSKSSQPSQSSRPDRTHLNQLQQELDELIQREISPIDPTFSLTQKVEPIPFSDIPSLIDERTAIVEWYITGEKILIFLVTHHSPHPQVWQSSTEDWTNFRNWVNEYLRTYYTNRQQWIAELETRLPKLAEILHLDEILSLVPKECDRLILIPHRFLHILPLHTLPVSPQIDRRARGEGKYILDLFPRGIQYAPSCQLLKLAQSQQRPDFRNLFAIQNPTGDLVYTDLEVETIRSFLPSCEVLARQAATEEAVKNYQNFPSIHCGHFCCHGEFNPISPLESALILADKEHWTLGEIFELSIPQCRLITLSACETGFTDPNSLSDEYIGLPSGFLFAGSPSVVSSLWTVDDLSTSFLMIKFYEILFNANLNISVAVALKEAQDWLQNLTVKEIEENLAKPTFQQAFSQLQQTLSSGDLFELEDAIASKKNKWKTMSSDEKPFSNPFYWAAFVATGV